MDDCTELHSNLLRVHGNVESGLTLGSVGLLAGAEGAGKYALANELALSVVAPTNGGVLEDESPSPLMARQHGPVLWLTFGETDSKDIIEPSFRQRERLRRVI